MIALLTVVTFLGFIVTFGNGSILPRSNQAADGTGVAPLSFNSSGLFQISIFEDLHFGEGEDKQWGPAQDIKTVQVMNSILDAEKQSLVVLNGDLITGENTQVWNASRNVDALIGPMLARRTPWASAYGNHDSDFNLRREDILAREHQLGDAQSLARTRSDVPGPNAGVSNYYLPVFPSHDPTGAAGSPPAAILWFFDSRGGNYYQKRDANGRFVPQPDWVDASVVAWFEAKSRELKAKYGGANKQQSIPSIAFVHIPTVASRALQTSGKGQDGRRAPGINADYGLAAQGQGWDASNRPVAPGSGGVYGGQDTGFVRALVGTPGLLAVFSAHDHGDDWCWRWKGPLPGISVVGNGIDLCFGRHSGYGGYSSWTRGSRQILLNEEMLKRGDGFETWVRLETGEVSGKVTLNSTYGEDLYPAVDYKMTGCETCVYS